MTLNHQIGTVFFIWQRDEVGYGKRFVGTVSAADAYAASTEARRLFGPGRYQVRASKWGAPVLAWA